MDTNDVRLLANITARQIRASNQKIEDRIAGHAGADKVAELQEELRATKAELQHLKGKVELLQTAVDCVADLVLSTR